MLSNKKAVIWIAVLVVLICIAVAVIYFTTPRFEDVSLSADTVHRISVSARVLLVMVLHSPASALSRVSRPIKISHVIFFLLFLDMGSLACTIISRPE